MGGTREEIGRNKRGRKSGTRAEFRQEPEEQGIEIRAGTPEEPRNQGPRDETKHRKFTSYSIPCYIMLVSTLEAVRRPLCGQLRVKGRWEDRSGTVGVPLRSVGGRAVGGPSGRPLGTGGLVSRAIQLTSFTSSGPHIAWSADHRRITQLSFGKCHLVLPPSARR